MLLKEQELLKKDEKILKLKMKLKKQKSSAKTNQEIEKGLSEYKKSLPQLPPISIPVEPFLVYRENDSEVLLLRDSLATSHNEIEILKKTIESNEKVSLNKLQDIELSYKAQMIMKEEEFIKFEVFFTKESELFQMKIKEIQEKYLISEVHLSKLHIKKKNLKRLYKESLKNIDKIQIELREYYEEQLDNLRHNISMVENEMKGVLERNNELEENLKDFNNEKNIILNNLNLEKEDNKLWHLKYEECLLKIKELQASKKDMKQFSLKNMEGYYENMLEIMQKFTMNYREKRDKISDKIVKEVHHHIPQAQQSYVPQVQMQTYVPQIQQTYVPQTCISHLQHTNCHPIETTTILEKTPTKHIIEKETQVKGKNSQGFEEM